MIDHNMEPPEYYEPSLLVPSAGDWVRLRRHRDWQRVIGRHGMNLLHESSPSCFHEDPVSDVLEIADEFKRAILETAINEY